MPVTNKRAILNYLEFLKSTGFIYAESGGAAIAVAPPAAAVKAQPPAAQAAAPSQAAAAGRREGPADGEGHALPVVAAPSPAALIHAREARAGRLAELAGLAEKCRGCGLGVTRNQLVFADGAPLAKIIFVGEAPGAEEDARGVPFVGRAGQLLDKMIQAIGFKREEVYICNTLKCRPPENRDPLPAEKQACEHFLVEQLQIIQPQIVVALGAHAAQYLCRSDEAIGRLRGRWHSYEGIALLATYHPAFLLRSPSFKPKAWDDFKMIHARYTELNPHDRRKIWTREAGQ